MKLRDPKLQVNEQSPFTYPPSFIYFALRFSEYITITSSEEALKISQLMLAIKGNKVKSSVTCNLPVQLRFI